ncbi:MAG: uracil-DNA glycosylase family protein [Paludibacteraceae bacterium]|jgi:uracil-DNA glycosylase
MEENTIIKISKEIRDKLKKELDFEENSIDDTLDPVKPFFGKDEIKLIIIGQDPTIQNEKQRKKITCTLNLNKNGSLKNYIEKDICFGLGITLENVYATNIFKYFYKEPPAKTFNVLQNHLNENLNLLVNELDKFPNVAIITLGEPVLRLLDRTNSQVRSFWDYNKKTKMSNGNFSFCLGRDNRLGKDFFPFPHQPSLMKDFYRNNLFQYIEFVKNTIR